MFQELQFHWVKEFINKWKVEEYLEVNVNKYIYNVVD
jgi:hypothetical protein